MEKSPKIHLCTKYALFRRPIFSIGVRWQIKFLWLIALPLKRSVNYLQINELMNMYIPLSPLMYIRVLYLVTVYRSIIHSFIHYQLCWCKLAWLN